jgi:hypothetical protein
MWDKKLLLDNIHDFTLAHGQFKPRYLKCHKERYLSARHHPRGQNIPACRHHSNVPRDSPCCYCGCNKREISSVNISKRDCVVFF